MESNHHINSLEAPLKIGVIGLGYVGLPLAVAFSAKYPTIGFDIDAQRVSDIQNGVDQTKMVPQAEIQQAKDLQLSHELSVLKDCNVYIITVPTPVDQHHQPDFSFLLGASRMVGQLLSMGDVVIYESTVYPGATEEKCVPLLVEVSGLTFNRDFFVGYSPERIVPGDGHKKLGQIKKVTSGSTPEIARKIDALYQEIISAGTHLASSIKVAEAAKIIENCQRDINISFMNELAVIFDKMELDTQEVLAAARTKWNFLPFYPGLVGGHCISVDPYYLAMKAEELGHHPAVILSGRRINDQMGSFVASKVIKLMVKKGIPIKDAPVLVLGISFKENCPDIRNTKVVDLIQELKDFGAEVDVFDPIVDAQEVKRNFNIDLLGKVNKQYAAVILAVNHTELLNWPVEEYLQAVSVVFDVKAAWPRHLVDGRL
ncbi:nucleotide sugar dehydrogenase [Persicobacter sp. CCB-QB2]|uniref:nucleotide sugar dehydrogenase n=1 Tax=Persicobacter sp. CCB-QB2 TaxID=1561025 RepID=UPI000A6F058D|nr:nucleotide sugar dehydrogenase [Persicobacter sp. CCB-QB2]